MQNFQAQPGGFGQSAGGAYGYPGQCGTPPMPGTPPPGSPHQAMSGALSPAMGYGAATAVAYGMPQTVTPGMFQTVTPGMFTPQEMPYYQELFTMADMNGTGFIDGSTGAMFLLKSGLPNSMLHGIWGLADANTQGQLNMERFFVALRLVAHAQAGRAPSADLVNVEPPALPAFEGLQQRRADSQYSPYGSRPPSAHGAASDISELQPVIAGGDAEVRRSADLARQASRSPTSRPLDLSQWVPSQREKRKYSTLFLRTDWNRDGFVEALDAKALLERSKLDRNTLSIAWEHADQDHDGRLTFPEFVALIHLITCAKKGSELPGLHEGLPHELRAAIMSLESPEELAAQRSRSTSPAPSGAASPAGFRSMSPSPAMAGASLKDGSGWGDMDQGNNAGFGSSMSPEQMPAAPGGLGTADMSAAFPAASTGGFDDWSAPGHTETSGFGDDPQGKSRRRKKKDRKGGGGFDDGFGSKNDLGGFGADSFTEPDRMKSPPSLAAQPIDFEEPRSRHSSWDRKSDRGDIGAPSFGDRDTGRHRSTSREHRHVDLGSVVGQYEAVIEADRTVSQQLRRDVDGLEEELRHVRETQDHLEQQVRKEADESKRLKSQQQQLERQLGVSKNSLVEHREDRRAVNLESISLRRDRDHFADELAFLQRMSEEEEKTLESHRNSNQFLEKSCKSLEAHTQQLELERKEVLRQVAKERELARHEERQNAEIKNQLERMQREQASAVMGRRDTQLRDEKLREMQGGGPVQAPFVDGLRPTDPYRPDGHSWANNVGGRGSHRPDVMAPGRPLSAGPSPHGLTPAGPRIREGV